jgi:hypothetical protein
MTIFKLLTEGDFRKLKFIEFLDLQQSAIAEILLRPDVSLNLVLWFFMTWTNEYSTSFCYFPYKMSMICIDNVFHSDD